MVGGDHEHARLAQRAGEEGEQQQRRQVGGVEVVEEHDERLARRGVAQEDGDGVEEREARLLGLEVAGLGQVQALAQLGRELGHPARAGAELGAQRVVVAVGRDARARSAPTARTRARRRRPSRGPTRRGGRRPRRARPARWPGASCRCPGSPVSSTRPPWPGGRLLERGVEIGQLAGAPEKREARRSRRRRPSAG